MTNCIRFILGFTFCLFTSACSTSPKVSLWVEVEGLPRQLAVHEGVFWARGTVNFREFIARSGGLFKDKTVYDIGTGTGIYALLAIHAGSKYAVATDIDPDAVANARFNARHFGVEDKIDVRLVSQSTPQAYSVLKEGERFDIVVSNPPWFGAKPRDLKSRQTTDEGFLLIKSIISDLRSYLNPGGTAFLAIGNTHAVKLVQSLAAEQHLKMEILDEQTNKAFIKASAMSLDSNFDGFFFPAVIIKITPPESR